MTAEIVIMNKQAVAIAADSAVTIPGQKTFSANKLFALSKYHPVCVMVYGSASFMGIPGETIIKSYRKALGKKGFEALADYADDFLAFLEANRTVFPESGQLEYFRTIILDYYAGIREQIGKRVDALIRRQGPINPEQVKGIVAQLVREQLDFWQSASKPAGTIETRVKQLGTAYSGIIRKAKKDIFHKLPMAPSDSARLSRIAVNLIVRHGPGSSGVVIAGFGRKDVFPALRWFSLQGIVRNRLRFTEHQGQVIDLETTAAILPFAQHEMVATFMNGVEPHYQAAIETGVSKIVDEYPNVILDQIDKLDEDDKRALKDQLKIAGATMLEQYRKDLHRYRIGNYVNPIMSVVTHLPKHELAAMAESLVRLTSFKRKVTLQAETVAEPIDVAVISKGDGFIWIKRKHYFQPELNPQFFTNYYREDQDEQQKE